MDGNRASRAENGPSPAVSSRRRGRRERNPGERSRQENPRDGPDKDRANPEENLRIETVEAVVDVPSSR